MENRYYHLPDSIKHGWDAWKSCFFLFLKKKEKRIIKLTRKKKKLLNLIFINKTKEQKKKFKDKKSGKQHLDIFRTNLKRNAAKIISKSKFMEIIFVFCIGC